MGAKEEMVEEGPETAMRINGNREEDHLAGEKVTNDVIARSHS